jgi:hypothetical protein
VFIGAITEGHAEHRAILAATSSLLWQFPPMPGTGRARGPPGCVSGQGLLTSHVKKKNAVACLPRPVYRAIAAIIS